MKKIKTMKWYTKTILVLFVIGLAYGLWVFSLIRSTGAHVPEKGADSMIILGAKVWGDEANPEPSPVLKERLNAGLEYLIQNPETIVIVSGGQGSDEPISEAQAMADYLMSKGLHPDRIILEDKSTTTKENISNSMELRDLGKTVLVSNDYHMYRALMTAERLGLKDVEALGAKSFSGSTMVSTFREVIALGYHLIFSR